MIRAYANRDGDPRMPSVEQLECLQFVPPKPTADASAPRLIADYSALGRRITQRHPVSSGRFALRSRGMSKFGCWSALCFASESM
jgi:hypothetical protein